MWWLFHATRTRNRRNTAARRRQKEPSGSFLVFGSHPVGMSNVVAAAAMRKGVFNLTRTGIAAELTAASGGNREAKLGPWSAGCERRSKA